MRGIAFIGGEGPGGKTAAALGREADIIAAADSGLIAAEKAGLKAHWIVGDMDSLDDQGRLEKYPPSSILRYPPDKDYTDTELALTLLWEKGCHEVWILGGGGGRTDHLFALLSLFERDRRPSRWITAREDIHCLDGGESLELSLEKDGLVSVFPLGEGPWEAESRGLKWPLTGLAWDRGSVGLSNVAPGGNFQVSARRGRFLVITPLGNQGLIAN
jgi:thiamine pyrophosphokinase